MLNKLFGLNYISDIHRPSPNFLAGSSYQSRCLNFPLDRSKRAGSRGCRIAVSPARLLFSEIQEYTIVHSYVLKRNERLILLVFNDLPDPFFSTFSSLKCRRYGHRNLCLTSEDLYMYLRLQSQTYGLSFVCIRICVFKLYFLENLFVQLSNGQANGLLPSSPLA